MRQSTNLREIIDVVEFMSTITDDMIKQYSIFFIAAFRGSYRLLYGKYYLPVCEAVSLYTDSHIKAIMSLQAKYAERDSSYNILYEKDSNGVILTDTIYACIRLKRVKIKPESLVKYKEELALINAEYSYLDDVIESYLNVSITVELMKIESEWIPDTVPKELLNRITLLL